MHILFIGYGQTSQRVARRLSQTQHHISTISQTAKIDCYATHLTQDVQQLDLSNLAPIDWVYVLLSPRDTGIDAYRRTYLDSVAAIVLALKSHPVQGIVVLSSTRVYAQSQGQWISDHTPVNATDPRGQILLEMEQAYRRAFAKKCIIVRPSGIYGHSLTRLVKLAHEQQSYANIHWSNRIHIDDLAAFLAYLLELKNPKASYICSDGIPVAWHEIIRWLQQRLDLQPLVLSSDLHTGKKIDPQHMLASGFQLQHQDCFAEYAILCAAMQQH